MKRRIHAAFFCLTQDQLRVAQFQLSDEFWLLKFLTLTRFFDEHYCVIYCDTFSDF
jgi:hypothetical protein